jgi:hypothetical protein
MKKKKEKTGKKKEERPKSNNGSKNKTPKTDMRESKYGVLDFNDTILINPNSP